MRDSGPDFLGIGAQKAATSWLWWNLKEHPGIWLPYRKELHYFDRSPHYPSPSHLATKRFLRRLFGREYHNARFRKRFVRGVGGAILRMRWRKLRWSLRYFLGTYDDDWYFRLFREAGERIAGEISPSYSILDLADVKRIASILPNLRVILILRNPIDRAWSHVRYNWTTDKFKSIDDLDRVKEFIDNPDQALRSDYPRTLETWGSCFPEDQFFVGFFDDVVRAPERLLSDVFGFLGVDTPEYSQGGRAGERRNISGRKEIPHEIRLYLAQKYYPDLQQLSTLLGGHAETWLREAEGILEGAGRPE